MIELTIKTLDSRNHAFTVGDEMTVKQLKDHIAESVSVPAESQRLIYCGRVLVDDKKLSEYDVNGKVIHLVQRAPPSSSSEAGNSGAEPRSSGRRPFRATIFNQGGGIRVDGAAGNAMYLGAMAFPADLMDAQGISLPNPRHVSQSRLAVVRAFIRRARLTLQNLENPALNESPTEANPPPPPPPPFNQPAPAPMDFAFVAQALSDAVSRAAGSLSNSAVPPPIINVEVVASNDNNRPTETANDSAPSTEEHVDAAPEVSAARSDSPEVNTTPPNAPEEPATNGRESEDPFQRARSRFSRPSALADLVSQAMNIHSRLAPFLDRYYELLREDPALENHQEAQRLFNSVSELLHHMAHAYHAISDVMCDFSQAPPRLLQCRPVLIHHSAVLQTGIPIQLNLGEGSQTRGTATGGADSERDSEGTQADNNGNSASAAPQREEPMRERVRAESEPSVSDAERRERTDRTPTPPRELRERGPRAFNLTPGGGLELIMDVGQGSIHIDSVEATVIPAGGAPAPGNAENSASSAPPELLNLWQALGHVTSLANRAAHSAAASNAAPSAPSDGTGSPPSNSSSASATTARLLAGGLSGVQAWTNTETQPTTSTQTRATTRPHVHISPGLQGVGMRGFFDPFLPCSSHHIRNHSRRNQAPTDQSESSQTQTGAQRPRSNSENNATSGTNSASGGSSQSHRIGPIRLSPDVTVVLQAPSRVSMEFPSGSPSLIDMIEASPPHFPEGTSLYADMFLALARHLTVSDVRDLNFRHILTRARPHLATFFRTRLTSSREDLEGINEGITRFNQDIRPLLDAALDSLDDIPMREDVDIIASINLVNTYFLPRMVSTIMSDDSDITCFMNFNKSWMEYVNTLASIFHYCCLNGESDAENAFMRLGVRFLNAIPGLEIWAGYRVHRTVRQLLSELAPSDESARNFLVYRMAASGPAPPGGLNPEPSVATAAVTPPPAMDTAPPQPSTPQPMEVEDSVVVAEQLTEELPDVILDVHPDWVPIITRDRERQRRQAAQGPLSDAYLSGMPSKRRKIVSSSKPQGSLARVISESMSTAITAAGVPPVENVVESAATDSTVQKAYKEQVRLTVGATVKSHPDFKPDKYPNSSKVFSSK